MVTRFVIKTVNKTFVFTSTDTNKYVSGAQPNYVHKCNGTVIDSDTYQRNLQGFKQSRAK